jgi:hypothetical protein
MQNNTISRDMVLNKIYSMIQQVWQSFDAPDREKGAAMQASLFAQPDGKPIVAPTGVLSLAEHYDAHQQWSKEQHQVLNAELEILNVCPLVVSYTGVHGWQAVSKQDPSVLVNHHVHQHWVLQSDDGSVDNLKWVSFVTPYIINASENMANNNIECFAATT